ncbi:DivIVA domain-containing protein [Arthrobacter sp. HLT1-20]
MTYFLIFLAVMLAAAVVLYVVGLNKPDAGSPVYQDGMAPPVANLPPVLLPDAPQSADVDKLRFSLGLRGYRMDQVDEVLDRLRDELAAKDVRIAELLMPDADAPAPAADAPAPAADAGDAVAAQGDAVVAGIDAEAAEVHKSAATQTPEESGVAAVPQTSGNG